MITVTKKATADQRTHPRSVAASWPLPDPAPSAHAVPTQHVRPIPASEHASAAAARPDWAPPLRGSDLPSLVRWAIACRASAAVLELEGHPERAAQLRQLAETTDRRTARLVAATASSLLADLSPTAA